MDVLMEGNLCKRVVEKEFVRDRVVEEGGGCWFGGGGEF
jgi:hypothetical protein